MSDEENKVESSQGVTQEEDKKRKPGAKPGSKINESQHRDVVATMLLMGQSYAYIQRYLEKSGLPVKYETLKEFESNYVEALSKEMKDLLVSKAMEERKKNDEKIIHTATYANLSRVETLVLLLGEAEAQINALKENGPGTWMTRRETGDWMDRVYRLRTELEEARLESEVQIERTRAIDEATKLAVKLFKDHSKIEEFIKSVDVIRSYHKPV